MNYKEAIQEYAFEIASIRYGKDVYELTEDEQDKVFQEAQEQYINEHISQADSLEE